MKARALAFMILSSCLAVDQAEAQQASTVPADLWLDTDMACGSGALRDIDDCVALAALATHAPQRLAGITLTYGNAPIDRVSETAARLGPLWLRQTGMPVSMTRGAARRGDCRNNAASLALIAASYRSRLTILAIGPATNLACAIAIDPALGRRLNQVVVVAGAVAGHLFHPSEGSTSALFGHGPIARDLNVQLDPDAMRQLLASGANITLTPYQASRGIKLTQHDMNRLGMTGPLGEAVAQDARPWLGVWRSIVGQDGFYPFDLLAVVAVLRPSALNCTSAPARVTADRAISGHRFGPVRLIVGPLPWSGDLQPARLVKWCGALSANGAELIRELGGLAR